ncbi:MAG: gamma-glutamyltransferase family protein [Thermoanaerobaculaceae bacterium]
MRSRHGMVASADPQASRAGARMLEMGGNAVDAAVATTFALGVVDPTCAGLGGQVAALVRLASGREVVVDGSATVPIAADPLELQHLQDSGRLFGHPVAATPTMLATMTHLLRRHGTMSLAQTMQPAIELAEQGHTLRPYVEDDLGAKAAKIMEDTYLTELFLRGGREPWPSGCLLQQPVLAATMRRIAAEGEAIFYRGAIAAEIEAEMVANGGYVRRSDLAAVRVVERVPLRARYRDVEVVSIPAPGGGDILLGALQILANYSPELLRQDSADRLHLLVEAVRIAMLDASTSPVPLPLDPTWARRRAPLVRFRNALRDDEIRARGAPAAGPVAGGTTQVSVVDRQGNAVALTATLGVSALAANPKLGFQYSSLLDGFDYTNRASGNHLTPMRAPQTTIAPVILLRQGALAAVLGSAGSARIPSSLVAVISNLEDRGLGLGEAVAAPRVVVDPPAQTRVLLELAGGITAAQADTLEARGFSNQLRLTFPPRPIDICAFGGVNAVAVEPGGVLVGVGDPRRQGGAAAPTAATPATSGSR